MDSLVQDLRYAARMLLNNRGFTVAAIIALTLGIGANTAIFSVVNAVLLKPLPFPDADRLVLLWGSKPAKGWPQLPLSLPNFTDIRERNSVFEGMAAWATGRFNLSGANEPEQVQYAIVPASFFSVLGVGPRLGRSFVPEEDLQGCAPVAIIGSGLWQRRFGADPEAVGKTLTLDGRSYEVIGIMPPGFKFLSFPKETEVWVPFGLDPFKDRKYARGAQSLGAIARLKSGTSFKEAQAEMDAIAGGLEQQYPDFNTGWSVKLVVLGEQVVKNLRPALLILLGAVGFVLLIACANVANLQLARARTRQREIAIRAALGAGRPRIIRQLLTESVLLSAAGGALGLLVAFWAVRLLSLVPYTAPSIFIPYDIAQQQFSLDGQVLAFTLALSLLAGLAFGMAPALQASRPDLSEALKEGSSKAKRGRGQSYSRSLLVVSEVALSMMLLIGAGLMIKSFAQLQSVDPGFQAENLLIFDINLPQSKYREDYRVAEFFKQLLERGERLPEVVAMGAAQFLPLSGQDSSTGFFIEGQPPPPPAERVHTHFRSVSPDYFRALGIRLAKGRYFTEHESKDALRVAIINETMARRFWPGEDPLGKRLALDLEAMKFYPNRPPDMDIASAMREIVGVVADVKHSRLEAEPVPEMYVPYLQRPVRDMTVVVRTASDPQRVVPALRSEVMALDKDQPVANLSTMAQLLSGSVAQPRFNMMLLSVFAALALILAAVGVYGVISYSVTERTHEIGIRLALGARPSDVLRLVARQGLGMALAGVALGLVASLAMTRLLSSLLFEVSATDPFTFAAVSLILTIVALAACFIPARRAAKVDPLVALRHE